MKAVVEASGGVSPNPELSHLYKGGPKKQEPPHKCDGPIKPPKPPKKSGGPIHKRMYPKYWLKRKVFYSNLEIFPIKKLVNYDELYKAPYSISAPTINPGRPIIPVQPPKKRMFFVV